jgi:hypothetical protein
MTDAELPDDAQAHEGRRRDASRPDADARSRAIRGLPAPAPVEEREDARPPHGLPRRKPGTSLEGMSADLRTPVPPDPEAAARVLAALTDDPHDPPPRRGRHL